jgi:tetratricopeptide (TPR) repeat protein
VVEGLRAELGDVHPDVISARANLASILRILKRTSDADIELQQAISDARTTMGDQHPLTLTMLNNLAVSFYDAKKYEEALVLFQELEQTRVALNGPDSLGVLSAQVNIASVIRFLGREKESRELSSDAISRLDRVFGENHPLALLTRQKLAEHFESDESLGDRLIQAELLYREIFEINERSHGLQHPSTLAVARLLVSNLVKQGRVPEAFEFCQGKIDIASTNWGASDSQTLQLIGSLGLAMQIAGQSHEAEKLFRQAYLRSQSLNPEDPLKSRAISGLVSCLNREMRYEESKLLLEARISELQAAPGDQSNAILMVQALLAQTIEQIGSTLEPDPNLPKSKSVDEKS